MRSRLTAALASFLCVLVFVPSAQATFPGHDGKIAYAGFGHSDIFTINPDGSGNTSITSLGHAAEPAWSADGTKIAFRSGGEIYRMNADGSGLTRLTDDPIHASHPTWSPDGTEIAFRTLGHGPEQIFVMNADGSGERPILDQPLIGDEPAWSPDGNRIAYHGFVPRPGDLSQSDILVLDLETGGTVNLTNDPAFDGAPNWSPDGSRIAFHSSLDNREGFTDLYSMNGDGTDRVRITHTDGIEQETEPAWSPDGTKIAYVTNANGAADDVQVMTAGGTVLTRLTFGGGHHAEPDWQPLVEPSRADYRNAARFCKAEREFLGDADFAKKYGTNGNGANAYGTCVSGK